MVVNELPWRGSMFLAWLCLTRLSVHGEPMMIWVYSMLFYLVEALAGDCSAAGGLGGDACLLVPPAKIFVHSKPPELVVAIRAEKASSWLKSLAAHNVNGSDCNTKMRHSLT